MGFGWHGKKNLSGTTLKLTKLLGVMVARYLHAASIEMLAYLHPEVTLWTHNENISVPIPVRFRVSPVLVFGSFALSPRVSIQRKWNSAKNFTNFHVLFYHNFTSITGTSPYRLIGKNDRRIEAILEIQGKLGVFHERREYESEDYYYYFFYQIRPLLAYGEILLDCKESADQVISSVFHAADQELRGVNGHRSVSPLQSRWISCKRSCYSPSSRQCQGAPLRRGQSHEPFTGSRRRGSPPRRP
jgi:hypothetical protein